MKPIRKLGLKDAFCIGRIIRKSNIKQEITKLAEEVKKTENINQERVGITFFLTIIESLSAAGVEPEMYAFIASLSGISVAEAENAELDAVIEFAKELIKENDILSFFYLALRSLNQ